MSKNTALKIVNPFIGFAVASQAVTGMMRDTLPNDFFEIVHKGGGLVLVCGVVLHLILNWSWIKANLVNHPKPSAK